MLNKLIAVLFLCSYLALSGQDSLIANELPTDGSVLPFPAPEMESITKPRLQDSKMKWPDQPQHLPEDAPNVLIILLDDVGFGIADTFGGEVSTPSLTRLANEGIRYNTFHTTSICSPTRAALLTGRNHTRVGSGTIAERAVAFDGYTGTIPKSAATIAETLKEYGYHTSAFGKWHNTPATETTMIGPKNRWPNGYGFEHFYGFLGGETSQWEPRLTENYTHIEPPEDPNYHLTEDLVNQSLKWLDDQQAYAPDKPFLMYWAPGGVHGPHHVFSEWSKKYKGKFDGGWDAYRERVHQRQIEMGIIPAGTKLTPRDETLESWDSIPEEQRAFQTRLMEIFAGYVEHTDHQVGRLVEGLEERGIRENTLIFYIFGDNGSSAEGQRGSVSELLAQNNIPTTVDQQIAALDRIGGLDALGTPKTDNMYHAGWAWAGSTPFKGTKLMGSHFGGTRNPMVISWPKRIKPDKATRSQFHHVIDIAPTIYDVLDITPPKVVHGHDQIPLDGVSLAYTFDQADEPTHKDVQFFDNNGSRAIYKDGWFACVFGPFIPWNTPASAPRIKSWDSATDDWELYKLDEDFSQSNDLAKQNPEKLKELKQEFLKLAAENEDFPIGAGLWLRIHPEDIRKTPYTEWTFTQNTRRMPEFTAPGLGRESNVVKIDVELKEKSNGVLYAVGGAGGGLSVYMEEGYLVYEYNLLIVDHYEVRSQKPLKAGKHTIEVITEIAGPGKPGTVTMQVDGKDVAQVKLPYTVPLAFTATETFDVGVDLGSPVSLKYFDKKPFEFNGKIQSLNVKLK
ncbi:Arylsulfatase [Polystyrenella longa]|uniref:Arylsulfatase n=1 Tax=Polystyrenella longa TaxID=2528007 RepID=A0A518CSW8_9PLAN|nr:sulfatase-like hydrolase/transferase [Polystyrenella longa]QDU82322.1 Arylsulfatase [Polystyrenella longa]